MRYERSSAGAVNVGARAAATGVALVLCVAWGAQAAGQGAAERRLVLFPVEYTGGSGPPVMNYIEDVQTGLTRNFSGEIVAGERLVQAMEGAWVLRVNQRALDELGVEAQRGIDAFYAQGGASAIPILERVVARADELLPHVSADPARAELLLKAHLFLWWSFRQVGEEQQLRPLMAATAERFPAAVVNSIDMPPYVAQAFNGAREEQRSMGTTLTVMLEARDLHECRIYIDGFPHGDGRSAGLAVRPGRTYYVTGACGDARLPPHRVVVDSSRRVELDMVLADRLLQQQSWPLLRSASGPDAVGDLTDLALAGGRALSAGQVVLAGVTAGPEGPVIQLDRVLVADGRRVCSVRLEVTGGLAPGDVDAAVRALLAGKPTPTAIRFAGEDHVYRTPSEYVDHAAAGEHRVLTWITLGVGGGALIAAGSLEVVAYSDQKSLRGCINAPTCRGTREAEDLRVELVNTLLIRNVLYGAAGVLALTSAALYFIEAPDPEDYLAAPLQASSGRFDPWIAPDAAGLSWSLDF